MGGVAEIESKVLGTDPFAALAQDPAVASVLAAARAEIDSVLWRRDIRTNAASVARASIERGGRDSAAIDGADTAVIDDSPMGRVLARAIDVTAAVPGQVGAWSSAPLQVIAALHAIAANDFTTKDELGRPRSQELADDPLRIGQLPPAALVGPRLTLLAELVLAPTTAPAMLVAGIVHAELLTLRPFAWGSGLVARAAARCVLAERAVDPSLFTIPENGMFTMGRPAYVDAMRAYASGTMAGSSAYLIWFAGACALGAKAVSG
ncbi:hypothetical protein LBMAG15_09210 [Actinomycetes bacterium]|nr:hypothetical protein LBMAG15_09210 [Actinomycetes bacterium]